MLLGNRAKNILGLMVFQTGILVFYLWKISRLPAETSLLSSSMAGIAIQIILLSIIGGALVAMIVNGIKDQEAADERDRQIEQKADGFAYRAMIGGIGLGIAHLFLSTELLPGWPLRPMAVPLTPIFLLSYFLVVLWFGEIVKYLVQLRLCAKGG